MLASSLDSLTSVYWGDMSGAISGSRTILLTDGAALANSDEVSSVHSFLIASIGKQVKCRGTFAYIVNRSCIFECLSVPAHHLIQLVSYTFAFA
jgi:hypothetical protein